MRKNRWIYVARRLAFLAGAGALTACESLLPSRTAQCPPIPPVESEASITQSETPQPALIKKPEVIPDPQYEEIAEPAVTQLPDGRLIVGGVEFVKIDPPGVVYEARIDSGANTSSLDARNLEFFERDGKRWVRFTLRETKNAEKATLEKPIKSFVLVSQTNTAEPDRRPVIRLRMGLGPTSEIIEFSLTDRSRMSYPVLLGRQYLLDRAVIDISHSHLQKVR